jgi:ribosome biogenesis GTPase
VRYAACWSADSVFSHRPLPAAVMNEVVKRAPLDGLGGAALVGRRVGVPDGDGADGRVLLRYRIGQSGTGKSTLVNALAGAPVALVAPTRQRDEKGRHTTTARELIPISGGVLIDTPGLRGVALFGSEEGVAQTFADIEALALECRFNDCAHVSEPDCAVNDAVTDGRITARRLASYRKLLRENERIGARTDARLAARRRREWQARVREARPPRP